MTLGRGDLVPLRLEIKGLYLRAVVFFGGRAVAVRSEKALLHMIPRHWGFSRTMARSENVAANRIIAGRRQRMVAVRTGQPIVDDLLLKRG